MNVSSEDVHVSELMERIRVELADRGRTPGGPDAGASICVPALTAVPLPHLPKPTFQTRARYALSDFLALHDRDFIDAAYLGVLKRGADPDGVGHFLEGLRSGSISKIEILGRLRYSPEGRVLHVQIAGLRSAYVVQRFYRLPVIGSVMAFGSAVLRLPRIVRNQQALESYQHQRNSEFESLLEAIAQATNTNERQLKEAIAAHIDAGEHQRKLLGEHATRLDNLGAQHARTQARIATGHSRLEALAQRSEAVVARVDAAEAAAVALDARMQHAEALGESSVERLQSVDTQLSMLERARLDAAARLEAAEAAGATSSERLTTLESDVRSGLTALEAAAAARTAAAEPRLAAVESALDTFGQRLAEARQASNQMAATLRESDAGIEQRLVELGRTVRDGQVDAQTLRQRMIERLARVEGRLHEQALSLAAAQSVGSPVERASRKASPKLAATTTSRFDALYFAFENRFRGTREDIRQRLAYYLPLLRESAVGQEGAAVFDIGCGRGEWLELLRDEKTAASGIDVNAGMVAACRERDLNVLVGDALAHLRRTPDNAFGAVTGFHIIEHVSLDMLIELIEEAHRVVQPGGLVIFETPNPENVLVGACSFYTDPTHQRPLPPALTQFLVESGGFVDVEIHRVNANLLPKLFDEPAADDAPSLRSALSFLRSAFLCAPDYSIVGRVA